MTIEFADPKEWITLPESLTRKGELGPAIRKLLVDEAHTENHLRYVKTVRELRYAALRFRPSGSTLDVAKANRIVELED